MSEEVEVTYRSKRRPDVLFVVREIVHKNGVTGVRGTEMFTDTTYSKDLFEDIFELNDK